IKEAQKEDSEIWTIVENLNKQVEFRIDEDNVLWQDTRASAADTTEYLDTTLEDPLSNSLNIGLNSKSSSVDVVTVLSA
nr:hypothetical protein [Tanacetum cinerariifolium]